MYKQALTTACTEANHSIILAGWYSILSKSTDSTSTSITLLTGRPNLFEQAESLFTFCGDSVELKATRFFSDETLSMVILISFQKNDRRGQSGVGNTRLMKLGGRVYCFIQLVFPIVHIHIIVYFRKFHQLFFKKR